ncbi:MAG: sugar ABC transporter substrate-binding protein [Microbacteriaceae bacterium]|nr:sugar ABC transporter substrate-binding protein [Microbacteriaceae bacterium]
MKKNTRAAWLGAGIAAALVLTGCSSGGGTTTEEVPAGEVSEFAAAAQAVVDVASQPVDEFVAPGPAIDTSAIDGGTVWFIAASLEIPLFKNIADSLESVFSEFNVEVQDCDGKFTAPDAVASCLDQAVSSGASAVIVGSVPYGVAPNGFDAVVEAGIPLVYTMDLPVGDGNPSEVAYITKDSIKMQSWLTNWVIADSNAEANTLVVSQTDHEGLIVWNQVGVLDVYPEACPDCVIKHIETNTGQLDKLVTDVSAQIVSNPAIAWVQAEADVLAQPVIQGVQGAGKTVDDIKITTMDGGLDTVQSLAAGQWIGATAAWNSDALAWYAADQALRLLTGNEANIAVDFPFLRLLTAENVGDLNVSAEGWSDGSWFGTADYRAGCLELWGK